MVLNKLKCAKKTQKIYMHVSQQNDFFWCPLNLCYNKQDINSYAVLICVMEKRQKVKNGWCNV